MANTHTNGPHESSPEVERLTTRSNRRRVFLLCSVLLLVVLVFIALNNRHKPYIQTDPTGGHAAASDRTGIPPDSLAH